MRKIRVFIIVVVGAVLVLAAGINRGQAARPAEVDGGGYPAMNPWAIETVESISSSVVGQYVSMVFHAAAGKPYISYYDATNKDLRLSYPTIAKGYSPDYTWNHELIDSQGEVGEYSSVDYYYNSADSKRKIGIAYYDATNNALKVAIWSCPFFTCGWDITTVEIGAFGNPEHSSLKFDSHGDAHISYSEADLNGDFDLMYASYVGSGGNCGVDDAAGKWQCDEIYYASHEAFNTSLDLTSGDLPVIAFDDATQHVVSLCEYDGATWTCRDIDNAGGGFPSLTLNSDNHAHIAYYNGTDGSLMYAEYVGSGGNCGSANEYQCDAIDSIGAGLSQVGISLAVNSGQTIIAYQDASDSQAVLNIARPIGDYYEIAGNCGPKVGLLSQWQCDTIDDATQGGGGGHLSEADYVSVDFDPTGLAFIAYYEYDDYYNEGRLKMAYQYRETSVFLPLIIK